MAESAEMTEMQEEIQHKSLDETAATPRDGVKTPNSVICKRICDVHSSRSISAAKHVLKHIHLPQFKLPLESVSTSSQLRWHATKNQSRRTSDTLWSLDKQNTYV
jgi:hypothetical protein